MITNLYTNDQTTSGYTTHFRYAVDLVITTQGTNLEEVKEKLESAFNGMCSHYKGNHLKSNLPKIPIRGFTSPQNRQTES